MGTLLIKVALVLVLFIHIQRCDSSEEEISSSSSSSTVSPSTQSSTNVGDRSEDESSSPTSGYRSTTIYAKSSSTSKPSSSTSSRHTTTAKSSTSKPSSSTSGRPSTTAKSTSKPSASTSGHHSTTAKSSSTSKPSTSTSGHHSTSAKSPSTSKPSTSTSDHHSTSAKSTSKPSTSTSSHHSTSAKSSTSKPSTSTSGHHSTSSSVQTSTKHATTPSSTSKTSKQSTSHSTPTSVSSKSTSQKHTTTAKPSTASSSKLSSTSKMSTGHSSTTRSSTSQSSQSTSRRPSTIEQPSSASTSQQISSSTTRSPIRRRRAVQSKPALPYDPFVGGDSSNPGTVLKLNKKLLVNHVKEACRKAEKEKCEDRSASDDIVFDLPSGRVAIRDLFLTSLSLPLIMVDVSPPNLLVWSTDKARLSATGSWIYVPSDASSTVNHTGKLYLPSSSFAADLNTSMGRSDENQPAISKVDCSIKISNKSNVIYSSPSIPARLAIAGIEANITAMIKNELESVMCYFSSFVLQSALNNILSTFHTRVELWDFPKISLDYSLITDPYVDPVDFSVNVPLNGSILVDDRSVDFYPHDMASVGNYSKMITTLFGDYVMNSFLASAYEAGMFDKIEVTSSYSSKIAELLALSCSADALCVGSALPYNSSKSVDDFAELSIAVNSTPSAVFLESGGFLQVNGSFAVRINNSTGKFVHYSSPFSMVASLKPSIREDKLYSMLSMEADVIDFQLSDVSKLILIFSPQDKASQLMSSIFQEVINKPLRQGIPVPMFFNNKIIRLGDHEFAFRNRTLILAQNPVN